MIRVYVDVEAASRAAADAVVAAAKDTIARRGAFRMGLSGGRAPRRLYELLAASAAIDWDRVHVLFADERCVPPDHPDSNYRSVRDLLLAYVAILPEHVHRMRGEADPEQAAREYETAVAEPLDLWILGVGEDGHMASLFPGSRALDDPRRVVAVAAPKPPPQRITVTGRVLDEARDALVLAFGASKADAVAAALEGATGVVPAGRLRGRTWYLDLEAAGRLGGEVAR